MFKYIANERHLSTFKHSSNGFYKLFQIFNHLQMDSYLADLSCAEVCCYHLCRIKWFQELKIRQQFGHSLEKVYECGDAPMLTCECTHTHTHTCSLELVYEILECECTTYSHWCMHVLVCAHIHKPHLFHSFSCAHTLSHTETHGHVKHLYTSVHNIPKRVYASVHSFCRAMLFIESACNTIPFIK